MRPWGERLRGPRRGATMIELLVSLVVRSQVLLGILPVLDLASQSGRGAENTSEASSVATQVIETLKLYRAIQNAGGTLPSELGTLAVTVDPVEVTDEGIWGSLGIEPDRFDMTYELAADGVTGRLQVRVNVRTTDPLAGNRGGGEKWVEFTSLIE
jgi:type II secretory pathway pseudopilin PulG